MNRRDYAIYQAGREAAARGAGLSDCPHGDRDGFLWRQGVRAWLDENDQDSGAGGLQEALGGAITTRPLCSHGGNITARVGK